MFKQALLVFAWLGLAAGVHAQSGVPLNFDPARNYGIPKSIVDFSTLTQCEKLKGQWPLIRFRMPSFQSQDCFVSDAKDVKVIVVSYHSYRNRRDELIAPIVVIFAREYDDPATAKRDYRDDWALINVGAETNGVIDENWRAVQNVTQAVNISSARAVYAKLVKAYDSPARTGP